MTKKDIANALLTHYSAPLELSFKQFKAGAVLFGIGLALILVANAYLPPSAKQEWLVLFGLLILAIGFLIAMMAQVRMLISRLVQFFRKNRKDGFD